MSINLNALEALASRIPRPERHNRLESWYQIKNATKDRAEIFLYGAIDDWDGISAAGFTQELRNVTASAIDLRINSPGGLVFEAVAIYTALKRHPATIDVHVDGLAASAASFVAMAGDSVSIEKPAKMMIHDARGIVIGNAEDMRTMGVLLDELSDTIASIYADRTGKSVTHWRSEMRAETWYSAEQSVKAGLADHVAGQQVSSTDSARSQLIRARARVALRG